MALRIVCADADKKAAASLARFLGKQRLPTIVEAVSAYSQKASADRQIVVWSRELAKSSRKQLKDLPNSVLVLLDKTPVPPELSGLDAINAQSIGQRENVAWRAVSQLVKKDVSTTYAGVSVQNFDLPEAKDLELPTIVETTPIDLDVMATELEAPAIDDEIDEVAQDTLETPGLEELDAPELDSVDLPELEVPELEPAEVEALAEDNLPEIEELPEIEDIEPIEEVVAEPVAEQEASLKDEVEALEAPELAPPEIEPLEEIVELTPEDFSSPEDSLPELDEVAEIPEVEEAEITEVQSVEEPVVEEAAEEVLETLPEIEPVVEAPEVDLPIETPPEEEPIIETAPPEQSAIVQTEMEDVPEFSDLAAAQPMQKFATKQKPSLLPVVFLALVLGALGTGVGLLHPESPFYGTFSEAPEVTE